MDHLEYIFTHQTRHRLTHIVHKFCDITDFLNLMGVIDGTHIILSFRLQRGLTPRPCDFFDRKKIPQCALTNGVQFRKIYVECM